ncbi:NAD(P)-binding protein [Microthyrium microscopicum]|uniref:NAD(P)-binding protein n=1 Tax=Microthyrium microscopicum TaxID=703497 RepID=A0A6A6UG97_9PEZI|nr:NAD(P)-binding protein [Microthyrium microscopicum]
MVNGSIIVTGGTGKTGSQLVTLLKEADIPFLLTSRRGSESSPKNLVNMTANFDMYDKTTFRNAFDSAHEKNNAVTGLFLVAPEGDGALQALDRFIDYAVKHGSIECVVQLTGSYAEMSEEYVNNTWRRLKDMGVQYYALRPTWFMENFAESSFVDCLKTEGKIYTAAGNGRIPFISTIDIARVAFSILSGEFTPTKVTYKLTGPELLSYDEVAGMFSDILNRHIEHVKLSPEQMKQRHIDQGLPEELASLLADLDAGTANGSEERLGGCTLEDLLDRPSQLLRQWATQREDTWK